MTALRFAAVVISLYGSKVLAYTRNEGKLKIDLRKESDNGAVFINTSEPGVSDKTQPSIEQMCVLFLGPCSFMLYFVLYIFGVIVRIDEKYLDVSTASKAYRLETYRSTGNVSSTLSQRECSTLPRISRSCSSLIYNK